MIPVGTVTRVSEVIKELGSEGVSIAFLKSMLQWDGIDAESSSVVIEVLKWYRLAEECEGVLRAV